MNYLKTISRINKVEILENEIKMHDLTFEAIQIIQRIASKMYEAELSAKIYYAWDAILQICKSIEFSNKDYR